MKKAYIVMVMYYAATFFCAGLLFGGCADNIYSLEPTIETDTLYTELNIQKHIVIKARVDKFMAWQNGDRITEFDTDTMNTRILCSFYANAAVALYVVYYASGAGEQGYLKEYIILEKTTEPDTLYLRYSVAEPGEFTIIPALPTLPKG